MCYLSSVNGILSEFTIALSVPWASAEQWSAISILDTTLHSMYATMPLSESVERFFAGDHAIASKQFVFGRNLFKKCFVFVL